MTAGQVPRERVIGNFKPTKSTQLKNARNHKSAYQRRQEQDADHLDAIKACPCAVCLTTKNIEAHHLKQFIGERGMGMRSTHKWTVPLCHNHHINGVETVSSNREHDWFHSHGIDNPIDLAAALYAASPDLEKMNKIIQANRANT